jgi:hypothetical protein
MANNTIMSLKCKRCGLRSPAIARYNPLGQWDDACFSLAGWLQEHRHEGFLATIGPTHFELYFDARAYTNGQLSDYSRSVQVPMGEYAEDFKKLSRRNK